MGFDDQVDVVFNVTLLHQEYVNGTKEKTNCEPFLPEEPCRGKSLLWAAILRGLSFDKLSTNLTSMCLCRKLLLGSDKFVNIIQTCLLVVMRSIGEFWWNAKDIDEQVYHAVKKKLTWYNGRTGVPPDTPKCGFSNELCPNTKESDGMLTFITF